MARRKSTKKSDVEVAVDKIYRKNPLGFLIVLFVFIIAGVAGYFSCQYVTRNDTFEIIGNQTISLNLGDNYTEPGAKAVFWGKDVSSKIKTETNFDKDKAGKYYVKYTISSTFQKNLTRYRYIIVSEVK